MNSTVIDSYVSLCRPMNLDPMWQIFERDRSSIVGPTAVGDVVRELASRHSEEELLASKLLYRNDDGRLVLHPFLAASDVAAIVLMDSVGTPFDLLTEEGCVVSADFPLFAVLSEDYTRQAIRRNRALILGASLKDVCLLRSFGLAAAPVAGVTELGEKDLSRLEIMLSPQQQQADGVGRFSLVFMKWTPTGRSLLAPPAIQNAIQYLQKLEELFGYDLGWAGSWRPSQVAWRGMEFALQRREPNWFRERLEESLIGSSHNVGRFSSKPGISLRDLAKAAEAFNAAFLELSDTASSRQRFDNAKARYAEIYANHIVRPLFECASAQIDPVRRETLCDYARWCVLHDRKMREVEENIVYRSRCAPNRRTNPVEELLAISKHLATLRKEIARWETQSKTSARRLQTISISHFARWGSAIKN